MATTSADAGLPSSTAATQNNWLVIGASSLGTVFEWYDFYLYGLLASVISSQFFSGVNEVTGFIFALAAFAAGFAVRPFGALVFGRLGDLVGRKHTFLITMGIMGGSTFAVGLLPNYATAGVLAPVLLLALRLLQGLALGGEYGGAATYVAENSPQGKRGLFTSFIQTTATLGLFGALIVVIVTRTSLGEDAFKAWGWRIPFLISVILLGVSLWIRMQLSESPVFVKMKKLGTTSKAPLTEVENRTHQPAGRGHGPSGGVVHGTVLRLVLSRANTQSRRRHHQYINGDCAGAGHSWLHIFWLAVRQGG
jgi:MFS family permease